MDRDELVHLSRRALGRGLRVASASSDRLAGWVAPWSVPDAWAPADEEQARRLILNEADSAEFERSGRADADRMAEFFAPTATVLDYGCGIGRVARHVAERCAVLWAVDVSPRMLELAGPRLAGHDNVRPVLSTGTTMPQVPSGSVDFAYSLLVLQHMEREDAFLVMRELRRVLTPEGRAYLTFPNLLSDTYLASFVRDAEAGWRTNPVRARVYTPQEVERLLPAAGLRVETIQEGDELAVLAAPA